MRTSNYEAGADELYDVTRRLEAAVPEAMTASEPLPPATRPCGHDPLARPTQRSRRSTTWLAVGVSFVAPMTLGVTWIKRPSYVPVHLPASPTSSTARPGRQSAASSSTRPRWQGAAGRPQRDDGRTKTRHRGGPRGVRRGAEGRRATKKADSVAKIGSLIAGHEAASRHRHDLRGSAGDRDR